MSEYIATLIIGLAGSFHCIGMCSPLAMAATRSGPGAVSRNLLYNGGRVFTYAVLGAVVSSIGSLFYMAGIQQWVALAGGILLLIIALAGLQMAAPTFLTRHIYRFSNFIKGKFSGFLRLSNPMGTVGMGMINGLLPCGMTLVALGYCVTLRSPVDGFIAMTFFGIGTLPAMLGSSIILKSVVTRLHISYRTIQIVLLAVSGVILIARGISSSSPLHAGHAHEDGIVICGGR